MKSIGTKIGKLESFFAVAEHRRCSVGNRNLKMHRQTRPDPAADWRV
jgi:hypothetical protein